MKSSIHNEYGRLISVLLKRPAEAFQNKEMIGKQWKDLNYLDRPDLERSVQEFDQFEQLISRVQPELLYLDQNETTGLDSIYTRDAAIATNRGMILCNMGKIARRGEPHVQKQM